MSIDLIGELNQHVFTKNEMNDTFLSSDGSSNDNYVFQLFDTNTPVINITETDNANEYTLTWNLYSESELELKIIDVMNSDTEIFNQVIPNTPITISITEGGPLSCSFNSDELSITVDSLISSNLTVNTIIDSNKNITIGDPSSHELQFSYLNYQ